MIDPVHRRGRPRLPDAKKRTVKMQTRVPGDMAEVLYAIARHRRTDISAITREFYEDLILKFETDKRYKYPLPDRALTT